MDNIELPDDITNIQACAIKYILKKCPNANMDPDLDYTMVDIVLHMNSLLNLPKIIKFLNEEFEENEIIIIINKSDDLIELMYNLINSGVERGNATAVICLNDEDMQIALSFIRDYNINNDVLSTMLYNKFENMFPRVNHLIERGIFCFDTAYWIARDDNDTEENINKMLQLISTGMFCNKAYSAIIHS
jgi:hypothetical protein